MLHRAEIKRQGQVYTAEFYRKLDHPRSKVWEMLTENQKLHQWFKEMTFEKHGENGSYLFDMGEGQTERLSLTQYEKDSVMAFNWWKDHVRFELRDENGGTGLLLIETIPVITDQTVKDLAGWHVCLDNIANLMDGKKVEGMESWKLWHAEYKRLLDSMTIELE